MRAVWGSLGDLRAWQMQDTVILPPDIDTYIYLFGPGACGEDSSAAAAAAKASPMPTVKYALGMASQPRRSAIASSSRSGQRESHEVVWVPRLT
jgi:hypothetical protein